MSQVINTNVLSLNAQRNLNNSQGALAQSLERLSSGLRINSAKDDAAGLAIAERFTTQIRGLNQAVRNANDGISFSQTAEGALGTIGDALQRIRELAVQSSNDTNSAQDRQALNNEVQQLIAEVGRVADATEFNGQKILDGTLSDLTFQVGANQGQTISVDGVDARTSQLGAATDVGSAIAASDLETLADLSINGAEVDLSNIDENSTTQDIVNAINAVSADSEVFASVASQTVADDFTFNNELAGGQTATLTINNVNITLDDSDDLASTIAKINDVSAQTGVTAADDGGLVLTSSSSSIEISEAGDADVLGGIDETFLAGIELSTEVDGAINVQGGADGDLGLDDIDPENSVLGEVNVLTFDNAQSALQTLDFALQQVNGLRAELGAVQIRFENTINNLEISSENLSAARSRIQDADFAAETAELTRAQVLQQAGTSVLSQANAVPQNVLALLQ
ncbi:flagellin [Thioalkalivibrio sp. ALE30]|uniref:flagellin N-terminal helical domain-containing protein n=1 Tax=Thioalkalivibrio sp. ALE30 TaxID=1158181 RepID=UPI00037A8539|nr:flagellin [Thioalkalivibrio sp. ALE30]